MTVRVRFAPSPTGHVHIGNIRAAIFNWLYARHEGGAFLLRVEDTDRERSTPEAVQTVLDAMSWLGLNYDEEPMYQSSRKDAHVAAADMLLDKGLAYKEDKGGTGQGECVIFRIPDEDVSYTDLVKGELSKAAEDMKDFVIVRSNGTPTFHLANVVDDIEMGITHIIRGDDHIENTYRHMALFRALGAEPPSYGHLPMIVNHQGKPYSKRDGAAFVGEFSEKGFLADALFNYLAFLGWNPGGEREKYSRDELVDLFTLDRVKSSPAQFDLRKLTNLNGQYVADLPFEYFVEKAASFVNGFGWDADVESPYFRQVCELMQSRTHLYTYTEGWKYFFSDDFEYEEKPVRKMLKKEGRKEALADLVQALAEAEFTEENIERAIREAEKKADIKEGKLNQSIRVAVTGTAAGAGLYETMSVLGRDRCIRRLKYAAENLC